MASSLKSKICANQFALSKRVGRDFELARRHFFSGHGARQSPVDQDARPEIERDKGSIAPGRLPCFSYPTHPIYWFN
jgi:hypothetical protein